MMRHDACQHKMAAKMVSVFYVLMVASMLLLQSTSEVTAVPKLGESVFMHSNFCTVLYNNTNMDTIVILHLSHFFLRSVRIILC